MPDQFEVLRVRETSPDQVRKAVRTVRGVPEGLALDATRGQVLELGPRRWTFVLSKEAAEGWDRLGKEALTVGALLYHHSGLDDPFVQRVLVALPGREGEVELEMRDDEGRLLWTGSGVLRRGNLEFSMPITRPTSDARGMMAGRINANGRMVLTEARLPRPTNKRTPTPVEE